MKEAKEKPKKEATAEAVGCILAPTWVPKWKSWLKGSSTPWD
jgi:hypothetical protein